MLSISSTAPVRFKGHTAAPLATSPKAELSKVWQEKDIYEPVLSVQGHALAQDAIQKCAQAKTQQEKEAALFWLVSLLRKKDGPEGQKKPYIDPNGRDQNGIPLINAATACNKPGLTKLLRDHGASYDSVQVKAAQDKLGMLCVVSNLTPAKTQEAIALLKTPGLNINHSNQYGETALTYAAKKGHTDIVRKLLKMPGINFNQSDPAGNTALTYAAKYGKTDIVRELLKMPGINTNHSNLKGKTALMKAAEYGYTDIVQELLKTPGIDVNHSGCDYYGYTALTYAAEYGYTDIVKELLKMPGIQVKQGIL